MAVTVSLQTNALVTADEVKEFCFADTTTRSDEEIDILYRITNGVSDAVENYLNRNVINAAQTEYYDGGVETLCLRNFPIISIASIYEDGVLLTAPSAQAADDGDYDYYADEGVIYRTYDVFNPGRQRVKITYTAGLGADNTAIPQDIKLGALIWIRQTYKSDVENYSTIITNETVIRPTSMPSATRRFLNPYKKRHV